MQARLYALMRSNVTLRPELVRADKARLAALGQEFGTRLVTLDRSLCLWYAALDAVTL